MSDFLRFGLTMFFTTTFSNRMTESTVYENSWIFFRIILALWIFFKCSSNTQNSIVKWTAVTETKTGARIATRSPRCRRKGIVRPCVVQRSTHRYNGHSAQRSAELLGLTLQMSLLAFSSHEWLWMTWNKVSSPMRRKHSCPASPQSLFGLCTEKYPGFARRCSFGGFNRGCVFGALARGLLSGLVNAGGEGRLCQGLPRGALSGSTLISVVVQNFSEIWQSATEL